MNRTTSAELKLRARRSLLGKYGTAVGAVLIPYAILIGIFFVVYLFAVVGVIAALVGGGGDMPGATVVGLVIVFVAIMLICILAEYMIMPGYVKLYLNICENKRYALGDLMFAFKNKPGKFLVLSLALLGWAVVVGVINFLIEMLFMANSPGGFFGAGFGYTAMYYIVQWGYIIFLYVIIFILMLNFGLTYLILVDNPETGIIEALKKSSRMMKGNKGRYFKLCLSFIGWLIVGYLSFGLGFLWIAPYMGCTFTHFYLDLKERERAEYAGFQPETLSDQNTETYSGYEEYSEPVEEKEDPFKDILPESPNENREEEEGN